MGNKKPKLKNRKPGTFMNFLTDFAFKKIFENKKLLIDFLNEVLKEKCKVVSLNDLNPEQLGRTDKDRKAVYDLYCKSEQEKYFVIEMQVAYQKHYLDRILFYATFPVQKYAVRGEWDYELSPVYCISIVNFEIFSHDEYLSCLNIHNDQTMEKVTDKLNFIILELPKFKKTLRQLETRLDWWVYCIKHLDELTEQPAELHDPVFDELFEVARINKLKDEDMKLHDRSILEYADIKICMRDTMELGMEKGMEKGIEKGMAKGRKTGFIEVAKNMLTLQYTIHDIVRVTGLSQGEITALSNC